MSRTKAPPLPGQVSLFDGAPALPVSETASVPGTIVDVTCQMCALEFRCIAGEQAHITELCTPCWYKSKGIKGAKNGRQR